jgi:hypothetical protein
VKFTPVSAEVTAPSIYKNRFPIKMCIPNSEYSEEYATKLGREVFKWLIGKMLAGMPTPCKPVVGVPGKHLQA